MRFSIVIPSYNRKHMLGQCLDAVLRQDYADYEVIVVDDGSTDGTGALVQQLYPKVVYIRQPHNQGPAVARNRGIKAASGSIIAFTDDDCQVPVDWLHTLLNAFERYPGIGAVGGIQEPPAATQQRSILARYERFVTHKVYGVGSVDLVAQPAPGGTNNLAIRKDILRRVGGFDESFSVAAGEDADLLQRIAYLGYETVSIPLRVTHHQTYSWRSFTRQQINRGIGAATFQHQHSALHPIGREVIRVLAAPALFVLQAIQYHSAQMAFIHTISGTLQTIGRLQARQRLQLLAPPKSWLVAPSPMKFRYVDEYSCGKTALDIGSGSGFYARRLAQRGFNVVSTGLADPAPGHHHSVQARLSSLPFDTEFDTVLCFDVLEHEVREKEAVRELRRVTGKRLLLSVPNEDDSRLRPYNVTYKHHIDKTHVREYPRDRLLCLLEEGGFHILTIEGQGPVNPAFFAEFIRPRILRGFVRILIKALHRLHLLRSPDMMADLYVVAEPAR